MHQVQTGPLHHVTLTVKDIKRSTEFYTSYFGFEVAVEFEPRIALSNGDVLLILSPPPDPAQAILGDRFNENRIGLDHMSLQVADQSDLESAAALFDEKGIGRGEIKDLGPGFGIYVMAVRDPDNIQLELSAPYGQ